LNSTAFLILFISVCLFLALSVTIVLLFDRPRIWDHLARSLVQIAIAIATVVVAISLFQKQLAERDEQNVVQQNQLVSAYLRSAILQQLANYKKKSPVMLEERLSKCDVAIAPCEQNPERQYFSMQSRLENFDSFPSLHYFSIVIDRNEIWRLMRSSPLVVEEILTRLSSYVDSYEAGATTIRLDMGVIQRKYRDSKAKYDGYLPANLMEDYLEEIAITQAKDVNVSILFVCRMSNLMVQLKEQRPLNSPGDSTDQSLSCPPYTDDFNRFFAATKAPRRTGLPAEWSGDARLKALRKR
jgi:type II secretory pathway pseudopilin PulG